MRWSEFEGSPNRRKDERARVTLNKRGILMLNKQAFEAFGGPQAVKLLFEEHELVIGLKPEDIRRKNAFPVKLKDRKYNSHLIHLMPFIKHYKIRIERTVLFNDIDIDNQNVMRLPLRKTIAIGNRWEKD